MCPSCETKIVVDATTRNRQIIALFLALISLGLTLAAYFGATTWWPYALLSCFVLAVFFFYAEQRVRFELYNAEETP